MASPLTDRRTLWPLLRWGASCLDFLCPPQCVACNQALPPSWSGRPLARVWSGAPARLVCEACASEWRGPVTPTCARCAAPIGPGVDRRGCALCRNDQFAFAEVLALGIYEAGLRQAILRGKSHHDPLLVRALADEAWRWHRERLATHAWAGLVAVPRYGWWPPWQRASLPDQLARLWGARLRQHPARVLRKTRATPRQALSTPSQRRIQQRGAFEARRRVTGDWLLVDDVLTTGGTAHAVAVALRRAGAARVSVLVLGRGIGRPRPGPAAP